MLCAAVQNVVYLRDLRRVLMEEMMRDFTYGVDIYLEHIRDANQDRARIRLVDNC